MKSKALSVKECTWMPEECHLVDDLQGNIQRNILCLPNIFRSKKVKPLVRSKPTYVVYHTARELLLAALDRAAVRELTKRAAGAKAGAHRPPHSQGKEQCTDLSEEEYAEAVTCFSIVLQRGLSPGDDCCAASERSLKLDGWHGVLKRNSFQTKLLSLTRRSDGEKLAALSDSCCHLARHYLALYTPSQNLAIKKYQLCHQQGPRSLYLALLCDMSSGFICSIYLYCPEQLQRQSRKPVLEQVVAYLLKHHRSHRHAIHLDSSAWINGQLTGIFSDFEVDINFIPAVKSSAMELASSSCSSPSVKSDQAREESPSQLIKHLDGWTGPALVLSSGGNESVDIFLPGLWATLHMVCINTFVLHTLQSQESGRRVHLTDFTRNLASQLAMDSSIAVPFMPRLNSTVHQETQSSNLCKHSCGQMMGRERRERSAVARLQGWNRPGVCGLDNSGNSCYLNAALQCLCSTVPLVEHLLHRDTRKELSRSKCHVTEVFVRLLDEMWSGRSPTCAPVEARSVLCSILPQFNNYSQQDAQELLLSLLNALHDDLKKAAKHRTRSSAQQPPADQEKGDAAGESTIVSQLFEGQLSYTSLCMDCGHQAHSTQTFTVLSLPIPATSKCCIQDCLSLFFEHTLLTGEEQMLCSVCELRRETAVVTCLDQPPEILVLHLKRFGRKGKNQVKLRTNVLFSMTLNLSQFLSGSLQNNPYSSYHLFAVLNHTGNLNMGHYTALCRNALMGTWHCFDDADVREVQDNVVQSPNAYVLVYSQEPFRKPKISGL